VRFGVATPNVSPTAELGALEYDCGRAVGLYGSYASFTSADFDSLQAEKLRTRGTLSMVTWEPWDPAGTVDQPAYSLSRITSGTYDAYVRRWARSVRAWRQPLLLRFAHEMNGDWYPWCEGVNGNEPGSYVAAWRHLVRLFRDEGACNAQWVWSPNVDYTGATSLASLYPGDRYVDRVAVDGFNWGVTKAGMSWQSFGQVFGPTLDQIRRLTGRPLMIGEVASTEAGGDKAAWIRDFFQQLKRNPDIRAFVWFNFDKETDWRIDSSPPAKAAFADGLKDARYELHIT
jgi:beta-mannanase